MLRRFDQWVNNRIYQVGDSDEILMVKRIWWVCLTSAIAMTIILALIIYLLGQSELALITFLSSFYWLFSMLLFNQLKQGIAWFGLSS